MKNVAAGRSLSRLNRAPAASIRSPPGRPTGCLSGQSARSLNIGDLRVSRGRFLGWSPAIFHAAAAALSITLAACVTTKPEPQIVTKEVQVPVPVHCHPDIGPEPDYPDTDAKLKAAPDLFVKVQLLLAGRLERMARDQVKSAALSACAG